MRAQLLRRLSSLERREQAQRVPQKARFPEWLIADWRAQGVPIDDAGMIDWDGMKAAACRA